MSELDHIAPTIGASERILAALLEARAGQVITEDRMWRIEAVLQPIMRDLDLPSLESLVVALASENDRSLVNRVIDALINHETYFFRDFQLFVDIERNALAETLAVRRRDRKSLSIWCVGCSTGQEPYSLAIMFAENQAFWAGWDIRIVASDISPSVIDTAKAGRYSQFDVQRGLPTRSMLDWFESDGDQWVLRPIIKDKVRFLPHNILSDPLPPGPFDLILCRNLLFYLTPEFRDVAMTRLADSLAPDGIFMVGAFETLMERNSPFETVPGLRGFYQRQQRGAASSARVARRY